MSQCLIEPAKPEDIPELAEFLSRLFTQESEFNPDHQKQVRGLRMIIENPKQGQIIVARNDNKIVGMVNLLFTISSAEGGPVILLEDMFVKAEYRNKGIGSKLLRHSIEFATLHGFLRITLLTDRLNEEAHNFYKEHGFTESPMIPLRMRFNL